jgi:YVTN family beta-propeller protein
MKNRQRVSVGIALLGAAALGLAHCGSTTATTTTETLLYVANAGDNTLSVVDTATNTVARTIQLDAPATEVRLHPFRNSLYIVQPSLNQVLKLLQLDESVEARIPMPGRTPMDLSFSPDSSLAFVSLSDSNAVAVLRLADNSLLTSLAVGRGPVSVVTDSGSTTRGRIFVINELGSSISVISLADLQVTNTVSLGAGARLRGITFQEPTLAYVADAASNSLKGLKLDTLALDPNSTIAVGPQPNKVVLSTNTSTNTTRLLVTQGGDNTLLLVDPAKPDTRNSVATGTGPTEIVVNSAGSRAYVANTGGNSVTVVDLGTMQVIATVLVGARPRGMALF